MIYLSADFHWYHKNILSYCPNRKYRTIEDMNFDIINNINNTVKEDDHLYVLGDLSMAIRPVEIFTPLIKCRNRHLISGNHCWCHSSHKKSNTKEKQAAMISLYESYGWIVEPEEMYLDTPEGDIFTLCHLPYKNEDDTYTEGKRYSGMYPEDIGTVLLCGHVHQNWKTKTTNKGTLMINVGVDVWNMKPVSLDQIREIVKTAAV